MKPVLCVFLLLLTGCSRISYLAESGVGQWELFNRARPVDEVMASPYTKAEVKASIRLVQETKKFAVDKLGLNATGNYNRFVDVGGPCVVWSVSAADALKLEERKWQFPIVGAVPYLGFFRKTSAESEAQKLREGFNGEKPDVWVRCVPAFSSLGWFADPLYSSMIRGSNLHIIDTVIHESLHATVWVGDSVDFNEKLASFVGMEGSLKFLESARTKEEWEKAKQQVLGEKVFGEFMKAQETYYKSTVKNLEQKKDFYDTLLQRYKGFVEAKIQAGLQFAPLDVTFQNWNNSAFLAYLNYSSDYSVFERAFRSCGGDLRTFVVWIRKVQKEQGALFKSAPENQLSLLADQACH